MKRADFVEYTLSDYGVNELFTSVATLVSLLFYWSSSVAVVIVWGLGALFRLFVLLFSQRVASR